MPGIPGPACLLSVIVAFAWLESSTPNSFHLFDSWPDYWKTHEGFGQKEYIFETKQLPPNVPPLKLQLRVMSNKYPHSLIRGTRYPVRFAYKEK